MSILGVKLRCDTNLTLKPKAVLRPLKLVVSGDGDSVWNVSSLSTNQLQKQGVSPASLGGAECILLTKTSLCTTDRQQKGFFNDKNEKGGQHSLLDVIDYESKNSKKAQFEGQKVQKVWISNDETISKTEQKTICDSDSLVLSGLRQVKRQNTLEDSYLLPGTGVKPLKCADYTVVGFCPDCGKIQLVHGNCHSAKCPNCNTKWRYLRTEGIIEKLLSYKICKKIRVMHAVVSPPIEEYSKWVTTDDIEEIRHILYRYCETKGFDGGVVIFHPYRLIKEKKIELQEIAQGLDSWVPGDFGLWKTLIKLENWRDFVVYSPHFHIIGAADFLQPAFKNEGWIFKRIGDLKEPIDILKCSMYLLSHCGLQLDIDKQNMYWFGALPRWSIDDAPTDVIEHVRSQIKELLGGFAADEGEVWNECPLCHTEFMDIRDAPNYWNSFDGNVNSRLKYCYNWRCGDIPPPNTEQLEHILSDECDYDFSNDIGAHGVRQKIKRTVFHCQWCGAYDSRLTGTVERCFSCNSTHIEKKSHLPYEPIDWEKYR